MYQKYALPIPEKCPFSPLHDIFHYHENNKTKLDTNKWKCEICGKFFTKENYLDKHFENKHTSSLNLVIKNQTIIKFEILKIIYICITSIIEI